MPTYVRDVMTPAVTAVRPDASLVEAAQLMRAQDIGDVVVVKDGQIMGVLTDRDITLRAVTDGLDPLTVSAQSVCSPAPVTVRPEETVESAVVKMRRCAIRRLPVVGDGGRPMGMVSIGDIAQEREPRSALADISRAAPGSRPGTSAVT